MLYTTPNLDWSIGQLLTPAQARSGLFRTRDEAARATPGRPTLAVAVRFDAPRGVVLAMPPASLALSGGWSAPAIVDDRGAIVVFAPIPAALVRLVGPASIRMHAGHRQATSKPRRMVIDRRVGPGFQRKSSALTPK